MKRRKDKHSIRYNITEDPLIISMLTIRKILKNAKQPVICLALYQMYCQIAQWENNNNTTNSYCAKRLKVSKNNICKAKKELIKMDILNVTKESPYEK